MDDTQDVTQGGTQEEILDNWIEMPYIRYVGSGYSGHWEVLDKEYPSSG
jgi:hypothetical protein